MNNIRQLFKTKAEQLELCDTGYLEKTMNQMSTLPKKNRDEMKRKMLVFLKCNPKKSQLLFNEIAGYLNDWQLIVHHDFNDSI